MDAGSVELAAQPPAVAKRPMPYWLTIPSPVRVQVEAWLKPLVAVVPVEHASIPPPLAAAIGLNDEPYTAARTTSPVASFPEVDFLRPFAFSCTAIHVPV